MSTLARPFAGLVALIGLAALLAQFHLSHSAPSAAGVLDTLWRLARFFTILTNVLTVITLGLVALGRSPGPGMVAGVVLSIALVGLVFHALLAPELPLTGLNFWADLGLHTLVPAGSMLWWLACGDKRLSPAHLPFWLVWPLAYCLYALVRGRFEGRYPYFFLDLGQHDIGFVASYVAGIALAFLAGGLVMLALARLLRRPGQSVRS